MKKIGLGAMMIALSFTAQATLIGDYVTGTASGMTSFSGGSIEITNGFPEFTGTVEGPLNSGLLFTVEFNFGPNDLDIYVSSNLSGTTYPIDFSVLFTDLDWVGYPNYVLTQVIVDVDNPEDDFPGNYVREEGFTSIVGPDSLQLNFASFPVPEFRNIQLRLVAEEGPGGPSNPVPEPATLALLSMGLLGLVARKKIA